MRHRSVPSDPLRALLALEAVAMVSSYALDVFMATAHINTNPGDLRSLAIYTIEFIVAAIALFSIPHQPNRRYLAIAVALCSVPVMVLQPTGALGPAVILAVLAARLTFAFGFRGTTIAWLVTFVSIIIDPLMKYVAEPTFKRGAFVVTDTVVTLVFTSLIYGVIGIMWLYARNNASMAASAERTRIALDLHDSLGHALTTLGVHLENANRLAVTDIEKARAYISRASALTTEILTDVRDTVAVLHDREDTQPVPLSSLLERLRSEFASAYAFDLQWNVALERQPRGRLALALYRVLQEALTNVARHSQAHRVAVDVQGDKNMISVRVEDDGRGFAQVNGNGYGLISMRSRVESVSGKIDIVSESNVGTRIAVTLPLESAS